MEKLIFSDNKMFIVEKLLYQNEQTNTKIFSVKDSKLLRQVIIKQIVYENDLQKKQILKEINNRNGGIKSFNKFYWYMIT